MAKLDKQIAERITTFLGGRVATLDVDIKAIQASWQAFDSMAHLRPIHDEAEYDRVVSLMNSLLDIAGDDEDHALAGLLDLVGDLVWKYEQENHAIEPAEPKDALRFLMDVRGLK